MIERPRFGRVSPLAVGLAVAVAIALAATSAALVVLNSGPSATAGPSTIAATPTPDQGPITLRWFVGLGSGTQPNQVEAERAVVKRFNQSQHEIVLELMYTSMSASDELRLMIQDGNPPDIVGPVGVSGRNGFEGLFMDLKPFMASADFDSSDYEPALFKLLSEGDAQVGLPYVIQPAYVFYNKEIFKEAGLPDLPRRVGETYMGKTWDWNTLGEVAARLTLDEKGRKATEAGFDSTHTAQWGIDFQWWDGRRMASAFGSGSFVAEDGKTAQIPSAWRSAWRWYYDAIWSRHIAPTRAQIDSDLLHKGATISSGRIAMSATNPWTINSSRYSGEYASPAAFNAWDMAVMPSWNGQTSGPLDIDTFVIPKGAAHPQEAFQIMLAIMADPELMEVYGGMPASKPLRAAYFAQWDAELAESFPGNKVSWGVLEEMAKYPAIPSHEADMPNLYEAIGDYGSFFTKLQGTPGLNIDAEIDALRAILQDDFDEAR